MRNICFLAALAGASCGCGMLYTNIQSPRSYRSASPAEVKSSAGDQTVTGEACNRSLLYLFAWGDGGYIAATEKALSGRPDSILYDVKCDMKVNAYVLGLYARVCTKVTGKAAKL